MKEVFVDTNYLVAMLNRRDQYHGRAAIVSRELEPFRMTTTQEVLGEFLDMSSGRGPISREGAAAYVNSLLEDPSVRVLLQSHESFAEGLDLYSTRLDKSYSHTDCVSMAAMRALGIVEALTHDHHFEQEGFVILL